MLPRTLAIEIQEALGEYVYALEDPRDGKVFYVGRGVRDRVLHHARDALAGDEPSAKLDRIRAIISEGNEPRAWILRHRLGRRTSAAEMEAVVIDVMSRWHSELLNEVRGAGTEDGIRSLEGLIADHGAEPLQTDRAAIVVNIGRTWVEGITYDNLWDAARKWWTCRPDERRPPSRLLLAEAGNIIRGAWTISLPARRQQVRWADLDDRRRAFLGTEASFDPFVACCFDGQRDAEWDDLVGRHTRPPVLPRSYGSAFRYLNC
ncbi:GIY-YIG nuclease family protein [Roseomonas eburnea]|uniref:GIY-YIG nuclease family protein n=1 Tax=Neoroseomonas eburnea TaxID=1346889 RepID=A0A9X9XKC3_9PROT|nr:GIY-YIG nuclease family protein [Neoroseomonas eburnea]MBR0684159.1 GIY-YIG nuclease family protein [Neoroseomonas eburnea]